MLGHSTRSTQSVLERIKYFDCRNQSGSVKFPKKVNDNLARCGEISNVAPELCPRNSKDHYDLLQAQSRIDLDNIQRMAFA